MIYFTLIMIAGFITSLAGALIYLMINRNEVSEELARQFLEELNVRSN